jgi:hypothetical protein
MIRSASASSNLTIGAKVSSTSALKLGDGSSGLALSMLGRGFTIRGLGSRTSDCLHPTSEDPANECRGFYLEQSSHWLFQWQRR